LLNYTPEIKIDKGLSIMIDVVKKRLGVWSCQSVWLTTIGDRYW
jgi:hypothetical protein